MMKSKLFAVGVLVTGLYVSGFAGSGSLEVKPHEDVLEFEVEQKVGKDFLVESKEVENGSVEKREKKKKKRRSKAKENDKYKYGIVKNEEGEYILRKQTIQNGAEYEVTSSFSGDVEIKPKNIHKTHLTVEMAEFLLNKENGVYDDYRKSVWASQDASKLMLMDLPEELKEKLKRSKNNPDNNLKQVQFEDEGFCYFPNEVKVGGSNMYYTLPCSMDKLGEVEIFGELVINTGAMMLTFKPIQIRKGKEKYDVIQGYALNGDKTMQNVANEVNERKIEKIGARILVDSSKTAFESTKEYYQNKNKKVVVGAGGSIVSQNQYDKDYPLTMTAMSIASGIVQGIGELIRDKANRMPVLFKVKQGQSVYVYVIAKKHEIGGGIK